MVWITDTSHYTDQNTMYIRVLNTVVVKSKIWRQKFIEIAVNTQNHRTCGTIGSD
jgi:hypothetical protein